MSIKTAIVNGVQTIEIARPEKKNALTRAMYQEMADALVTANALNLPMLGVGQKGPHSAVLVPVRRTVSSGTRSKSGTSTASGQPLSRRRIW